MEKVKLGNIMHTICTQNCFMNYQDFAMWLRKMGFFWSSSNLATHTLMLGRPVDSLDADPEAKQAVEDAAKAHDKS